MKRDPSRACFIPAEETGHRLQESCGLARKKGKGVWCPAVPRRSPRGAVRWAVGNASRQADPAGAKGFPTKPSHSRDARQKVQGVKHGQGSLNIFHSVCNVRSCTGRGLRESDLRSGYKLPQVNEGVKRSLESLESCGKAVPSLNTSPRANEAINMWRSLPLVAGGLEMKGMEHDPAISGNKRGCPGLPVPRSPREPGKPAQKRDHTLRHGHCPSAL